MEMKGYQKAVIADLTHYLELLNETQNYMTAFELFWREKSAPALGLYRNVIAGVPNLCIKVPTGGGKTFIACNAIRPVFDALPVTNESGCLACPVRSHPDADGESPERYVPRLPSEN